MTASTSCLDIAAAQHDAPRATAEGAGREPAAPSRSRLHDAVHRRMDASCGPEHDHAGEDLVRLLAQLPPG